MSGGGRPIYPTIGPDTGRNRPITYADEHPLLAALRSAWDYTKPAIDFGASFLPGGVGQIITPMVEGMAHDIHGIGEAVADRNVPGAGGREEIFNRALPLALGAYPIGGEAAIAERSLGEGSESLAQQIGRRSAQALEESNTRPGDAETLADIRKPMDLAHYSDDDLRAQEAITQDRLNRNSGNMITEADNQLVNTHDEHYLDALHQEAQRRKQRDATAVAAGRSMPQGTALRSRTEDLLHELGYYHGEDGTQLPGPGGNAGGRLQLGASMSREEAVALNRASQAKGLPTEMQRNPDGTFDVWQKGEGAATPRLKVEADKNEERLSVLTPEERTELEELPFQISEHMRTGLDRAKAAGVERARQHGLVGPDSYDPETWQQVREEAEPMRDRLNDLKAKVQDADNRRLLTKALTEPVGTGGLTDKEAKTLSALRKQQGTLNDALEQYRSLYNASTEQDGTEPTDEMYAAYNQALEQHQQATARIEELAGREHLPRSPGTAVAKRAKAEVAPALDFSQGTATPGGFQSRTVTALSQRPATERMSAEEWYQKLLKDPNVPKAEVEATMGNETARTLLDEQNPAGLTRDHAIEVFEQQSPTTALKTKALTRTRRELPEPSEETEEEADDAERELTDDEQEQMDDEMYQRAHEIVTERRQNRREEALEEEMNYQREREAEYNREERIPDALRERDAHIDDIESLVDKVFGPEGSATFMKSLREHPVETYDGAAADDDGNGLYASPFFRADQITGMGSSDLKDLTDHIDIPDQLHALIQSLGSDDPQQLRLGHDIHVPLEGRHAGEPHSFADILRPEMTPEQVEEVHSLFADAMSKQDEAFQHEIDADAGDFDEHYLREQAEETLDNHEDFQTEGDNFNEAVMDERDNLDAADFDPRMVGRRDRYHRPEPDPWVTQTEYHTYQRVDKNAPYEEVLVQQPGAGVSAGHFNDRRDLIAHARAEIHGDTYLMIEAQSDASHQMREIAAESRTKKLSPPNFPFKGTDEWVQLSTGAALMRAAKQGLKYFAYVSPENRMEVASLKEQSANITYGKAVPKAIDKIFKALGEKPVEDAWEPQTGDGTEGGPFTRIELTEEMRRKILKAGIPALGLGGAMLVRKDQGAD